MATFKKGQSFKGQRVHVSSVFEQKGQNMDGMNVAFSMSNDTRELDDVFTDPMLVYDKYTDAEGVKKNTFTAEYSKAQWESIKEAANFDGDAMVLDADLFPNRNGKGLVVNTNTLKTPEQPFDKEAHKQNTLAAREAKKAQYAQAAAAAEAEAEDELEV